MRIPGICAATFHNLALTLIFGGFAFACLALGAPTRPASAAAVPELFRNLGGTVPEFALQYPVPEGFTEIPADAWTEWPGRYAINRDLPSDVNKWKGIGYIPYATNFMDLVFQDTVPRPDQLDSKLSLRATPGELETGALAVFALKALSGVKVTVSDFRDKRGRVAIPSSNAEVRSAFYMRRRVWDKKLFVAHPTILERGRAVSIEPGHSQLYYVTVYVPEKAAPGKYTASLTLHSGQTKPRSMAFELTVLPFKLMKPDHRHFFCYHDDTPASFYKDFVAMRYCGMNSVMVCFGADPKVTVKDGKATFDISTLDRLMTDYLRAGLTGKVVYNMVLRQLLELSDEQFMEYLRHLNAVAKQRRWPGFIWSIGDEDDADPSRLERAMRMLSIVKRGVPRDVSENTIVYPENSEAYGNRLDVRVFSSYFDGSLGEKTRRAGNTLGIYNGTGAYEIDPRDNRFFWGLWAWRSQAEVLEQWVYSAIVYKPDQPFDDLAEPTGIRGNCHSYCYPGPDGPLPTVGYYGIMEGIDDARYLYTLEQYCKRAKGSKNADARRIADQAADYLSRWKARIDLSALPDRNKEPYFTIRREVPKVRLEEYDTFRRTATDFIVRLKTALEQRDHS